MLRHQFLRRMKQVLRSPQRFSGSGVTFVAQYETTAHLFRGNFLLSAFGATTRLAPNASSGLHFANTIQKQQGFQNDGSRCAGYNFG